MEAPEQGRLEARGGSHAPPRYLQSIGSIDRSLRDSCVLDGVVCESWVHSWLDEELFLINDLPARQLHHISAWFCKREEVVSPSAGRGNSLGVDIDHDPRKLDHLLLHRLRDVLTPGDLWKSPMTSSFNTLTP